MQTDAREILAFDANKQCKMIFVHLGKKNSFQNVTSCILIRFLYKIWMIFINFVSCRHYNRQKKWTLPMLSFVNTLTTQGQNGLQQLMIACIDWEGWNNNGLVWYNFQCHLRFTFAVRFEWAWVWAYVVTWTIISCFLLKRRKEIKHINALQLKGGEGEKW